MFRDGLRIGGIDRRVSGSWAAGNLLSVNGSTIVAGSGGSNFGTAVLDFGSSFTDSASVAITGQTWVTASSPIRAWFMADICSDTIEAEHEYLGATCGLQVVDRVAGVGFTINAYSNDGFGRDLFLVHWEGTP